MKDTLTIFYDGKCPLCNLEMHKLKQYDQEDLIVFVNLHIEGFKLLYPDINKEKAMKILHGKYKGEILLALNVTHRAWSLIGKKALVAPLQWPIIKQVAHGFYLLLAKYRHPISNFLYHRFGVGSVSCIEGVCYGKPNNSDHRSK